MRYRLLPLLVVLVAVLAAGCAGDDVGGGGGGLPPTSATPTPTPTPPPAGATPSGPTVTLIGEIQAGVEAGCLILAAEDGGGSWLLLGGDRSVLRVGARVQVTGTEARDLATTCQQGRPFQVRSVRPA